MSLLKKFLGLLSKLFLWLISLVFLIFALLFFPAAAGFIFFILALLFMPVRKWQDLIRGVLPKKWIKPILAVVLFFVGIFVAPTDASVETDGSTASPTEYISVENEAALVYAPNNAAGFVGMDYKEAEALMLHSGFSQITFSPIDDIDSQSSISDGTVESVSINGSTSYSGNDVFERDTEVIITYHNIPKFQTPVTSDSAKSMHYMAVGEMFYNAGFRSVETAEHYDLASGSLPETHISVNGAPLGDAQHLAFDSKVSVIGHYPQAEYPVTITIDFEANWLFSKYGLDVSLSGTDLESLDHGESTVYELSLPIGDYELLFYSEKDSTVCTCVSFNVNSETDIAYKVRCLSDKVEIKETSFSRSLASDSLILPFSSYHCMRQNYESVVSELKSAGFTDVSAVSTTNNFWSSSDLNSVVAISIGESTSFSSGHTFLKSAPVTVYYHVADFAFEQTEISATEHDIFEIPYSLTSGDREESFSFEIDSPDVLRRNPDGSYTALTPGTAVLSVSAGGQLYSLCTVDVSEKIIPIESISFAQEKFDVVVGKNFTPDFEILPADANYTDMTVEISASGLEQTDSNSFCSSQPGDFEISYYQDERLLGSCIIHSEIVNIEELIPQEAPDHLYVGDFAVLNFGLFPENASCKGIKVSSSNSKVAETVFDDRGEPAITIAAKSAGNANITVSAPNGSKFTHSITVEEILPEEITLVNTQPDTRIEVGSPISLELVWSPEETSIKEVSWASSNSKVIKVNSDGTLEAIGVGTADISAKHKSGVSAAISITVEPTLVEKVDLEMVRDSDEDIIKGDKLSITATVFPENSTSKALVYSSSNEEIVKVSDKGVITAVGVGTATITVSSPDGPEKTMDITVAPSPQKFRIAWSASMISNDHVGSSWSKSFELDDKSISSGSTFVLDPGASFDITLTVQENDSKPDTGYFYKQFTYSEELCKNGFTTEESISVYENGGRYSGHSAEWQIKISITPIA